MVNEDILTSLKNAIESGESLQQAMNVIINSGYNPREVQEAARFLGQGVIGNLEIRSNESLAMPNQRGMPMPTSTPIMPVSIAKNLRAESLQKQSYNPNEINQIKQEISSNELTPRPTYSAAIQSNTHSMPLATELNKIAPAGKSYMKEIVLLVILLVLIGALIGTILFRNNILNFFSA